MDYDAKRRQSEIGMYGIHWLGRRDSNPDTQLQRLQSYR
jgi:hypothetical protein